MKKDYSILMIALSTVFCACFIGIAIIYWKHFPAFYLACTVIGGIAFVISVVCLVLRMVKRNSEEKFYKRLMYISMISAATTLGIIVIGTLITMFM